jgi:hypothetical protein
MWCRIDCTFQIFSLECVVAKSSVDNLIQVLMEALMTQGGLTKDMIGKMLMTFGANSVFIFQGVRSRVTKQISYGWAPHSMGEYCMACKTNLMIQTLFHLLMVNRIESLLSTL